MLFTTTVFDFLNLKNPSLTRSHSESVNLKRNSWQCLHCFSVNDIDSYLTTRVETSLGTDILTRHGYITTHCIIFVTMLLYYSKIQQKFAWKIFNVCTNVYTAWLKVLLYTRSSYPGKYMWRSNMFIKLLILLESILNLQSRSCTTNKNTPTSMTKDTSTRTVRHLRRELRLSHSSMCKNSQKALLVAARTRQEHDTYQ